MAHIWALSWPRLRASLGEWAAILVGLATAQGLSALALIVVARRIPPSEFGQYLASYNLASLLVVLPAFGMDSWLLTRVATRPGMIQAAWWNAFRVRFRLLLTWLTTVLLLALLLPSNTFPFTLLVLSAFALSADSLTALAYAALRNLRRNRWVATFQALGAAVLFGGALLLPFGKGQVAWFALFRAATTVGLATLVLAWMIKNLGRTSEIWPAARLLHEAKAFMLADVAVAIYLRADLTIVSFILGSDGASVYGPALNLANMSFLVPSALYFLVVPVLAQARLRSMDTFDRLGKFQALGQLLSGLLLTAIMFVLAEPIIRVFYGGNYLSSAAVLRLLSPMLAIKSLNFGMGALLTTAGLQAHRTTMQVGVATFNACGNLVAVSIWGVMGAAVVYILSEALLLLGYLLIFLRWRRALAFQDDIRT